MDTLSFLFTVALLGLFLAWVVFPIWWQFIPRPKGVAKSPTPDFKLYRGFEGLDD